LIPNAKKQNKEKKEKEQKRNDQGGNQLLSSNGSHSVSRSSPQDIRQAASSDSGSKDSVNKLKSQDLRSLS
jgi:hypothetical protein